MNSQKDQQKILRRFKIDASSFGEIFQNPLNFFVTLQHFMDFFTKSDAVKYMPQDLDKEFELGGLQIRMVNGRNITQYEGVLVASNCNVFIQDTHAVLYKCTGSVFQSTVWCWECSLLLQRSLATLWQSNVQIIQ